MFSNIVTAAKGLFSRSESEDNLADPASAHAPTTPDMATTQHGTIAPDDIVDTSVSNGSAKKSKRKAVSGNTEKAGDQHTKRRKRSSLEAPETAEDESMDSTNGHDADENSNQNASKKHFRFGSEEPAAPVANIEQTPQQNQDEDEDSDDDAPETIDNSAQLMKMKEQAKKQEKAKQLEEQLKREKRRKLDERRKIQAKSSSKVSRDVPSFNDDLLSESTTTLVGSVTQDAPRLEIPALLPDDILNAEPVFRPPTPPAEDTFAAPKKSAKLRFLDKTEKPPKDLHDGDVTIRVLDAPSTKQNASKPVLAPKASKSGKNVKGNWLKRPRSTGNANGMRRTAGAPSSFVRR